MIKEVPCMECDGKGFIAKFGEYSVWSERCPNCGGTGIVKVPMTNADRIRAMSDWELAVAAVRYKGTVVNATRYGGHEHKFYGPHGEPCANKEHAILMWFNWLQRQAEEDT